MNPKLRVAITALILAVLVVSFYFGTKAITGFTGKSIFGWLIKDTNDYADFAKCLSVNGAKMYGASWCGHCQNQKKMFGDAWNFMNYVECDPRTEGADSALCLSKGIQGYPTWEISGKLYPGEMSFEKLAELSGCKLN